MTVDNITVDKKPKVDRYRGAIYMSSDLHQKLEKIAANNSVSLNTVMVTLIKKGLKVELEKGE